MSSSLEDRLAVALSRRGDLRIGQFISSALDRCRGPFGDPLAGGEVIHDCAFGVPDDAYVIACERYADSLGADEREGRA